MTEGLIEARSLTKDFDEFRAVDAVDLTVGPGEVVALLGPNGAGKTTTIRMLASLLTPSSGTARVAGFDVRHDPDEVRARVGLLTEHHGLYMRMRSEEYLEFFGGAYRLPRGELQARAGRLLEEFGLAGDRRRRLGEYSKGMRQKLALVRALLHDPPVLLLDEPTSAMDPSSAFLVRGSIEQLRAESRAIIVCTHNLKEAEMLADRIAIIRGGRLIATGTAASLKQQYLGRRQMEIHLARPLDGAARLLPQGTLVVASGPDWLRYETEDPHQSNPRFLHALSQAGIDVVTLAEVERSLEDVYLQVVGQPRLPA
jgi:ABC-2 type transport system ATP-binding protein